ncbi:hypothetical protein [Streptomyces sp. HC307]|uniref:hypothetical protein n=1 Tax=Streptomyces flavusporus TaxID=3385496 RepID=UPI0039170583
MRIRSALASVTLGSALLVGGFAVPAQAAPAAAQGASTATQGGVTGRAATAHATPVQSEDPAIMELCGWSPPIYGGPTVYVSRDNTAVRTGPGSECYDHSRASAGVSILAGCKYQNSVYGTWWVMTQYGWIYSGNLSSGWQNADYC